MGAHTARPLAGRQDARVVRVIRMAIDANILRRWPMVSLACDVHGTRDHFEVVRPYAVAGVAEVVPLKTKGGLADEEMVGEAILCVAVAGVACEASPKPAITRLVDLSPKTLFGSRVVLAKGSAFWAFAPALIVHVAKAKAIDGSLATRVKARAATLGSHLKSVSGVMRPDVPALRPLSILPAGAH